MAARFTKGCDPNLSGQPLPRNLRGRAIESTPSSAVNVAARIRTALCTAAALASFATVTAWAQEAPAEIDYLLTTMGSSDCAFFRNDRQYTASEAEAHLRMKYQRGKRYATTTEDFIRNLASRSSMSKKPYYISCQPDEMIESGTWLTGLLAEYRARSVVGTVD
jgi:hypothetical protein